MGKGQRSSISDRAHAEATVGTRLVERDDLVLTQRDEREPGPKPVSCRRARRRIAPGEISLTELNQWKVVRFGVVAPDRRRDANQCVRAESCKLRGAIQR